MAGNGSVIVLENLKDIRSTTKQRGKRQRRRHHGWSYEQLKYFIEYTAEAAGCRVRPSIRGRQASVARSVDTQHDPTARTRAFSSAALAASRSMRTSTPPGA